MIRELAVENIAIIEQSILPLGEGLTVLTGETGAGKSLLMDGIDLALGGRADSDLVRTGCARGVVSMVADLTGDPLLQEACAELGIFPEDGILHVQREVSAEGRSTCRIGGKLFPVGTLRKLGELLVDLHGQHDHQGLLHADRHGGYLDAWIGEPCRVIVERLAVEFEAYEALKRKVSALRQGMREREQRIDLLRFQVQEIEAVGVRDGEYAELQGQIARLQNVERISGSVQAALQGLSGEDASAVDRVGDATRQLEAAQALDPSLEATVESLRSVFYALQDSAWSVREYAEKLEADPALLEELVQRTEAIRKLLRKYGDTEDEILRALELAQKELSELNDLDANSDQIEADCARAEAKLTQTAAELTELRREKSHAFADQVQGSIRELAMEKAIFEVRISPQAISATGADLVEFFFSANPGESPKPLAKVASGGELSRLMLGLKVVLAGCAGTPTLIFDEVDAGLSGRAAAVVAKKLEQLATGYQVIVISHLPQISSRATTHFRIEKIERQGRVTTQVRLLQPAEREQEIARMLAGETISDSALVHARELLSGVLD